MKRYLFMGLVVLGIGAEASNNPFDLKDNLKKLDQSEDFILSELEKVSSTKSKKTATNVEPEAKGTDLKMIHNIVTESPAEETKPEVVEEQTSSITESNDAELAGVEENDIANVISDVVTDAMAENEGVKDIKEETQNLKEEPLPSNKKILKITVQDAPAKEKSKATVAPAIKQPVLEIHDTKNDNISHEVQTITGSKLTPKEIQKIYRNALKEAEGR